MFLYFFLHTRERLPLPSTPFSRQLPCLGGGKWAVPVCSTSFLLLLLPLLVKETGFFMINPVTFLLWDSSITPYKYLGMVGYRYRNTDLWYFIYIHREEGSGIKKENMERHFLSHLSEHTTDNNEENYKQISGRVC